jgi:hypothetical protein
MTKRTLSTALLAGLIGLAALPTSAATTVAPLGVDTFLITIPVGDFAAAATTADAGVVAATQNCKALGIAASAGAMGGTSPTLTVDVEIGTADIIADPITVTAAAQVDATTIDDDTIAKGDVIHVDTVVGGTNPTVDNVIVTITCARY